MKNTLLLASAIIVIMFGACRKDNSSTPTISNVKVSDCHTNTDKLAAKSMNTDSIVVSWAGDNTPMQVAHYNMMLDCGKPEINTTI